MLKKNILANLFGNAFSAIVSIVCIPVYVHYLGVEAFGLIGVFTSLQVIFSVLDLGLSATLNREFARLSVVKDGVTEQKNLLRTFEYIYFTIALVIGLVISLSAPLISRHWLSGNTISPKTVQYALIQMGFLLALRWPTALYAGGLGGLQKQVLYNTVNTAGEFVKAIGAIVVLAFVDNSITAFFYWQIVITGVIVLVLRLLLWKKLPVNGVKPFFSKPLLIKNKTFAAGMGATSLVVIILTQTDKIILSKILDLKTFGYFTLASAIAASLYRIIVPVSQAVYPRLVQLVHSNNDDELVKTYHFSCQLISIIVIPVSLTIAFFSKEVVLVWTNNAAITESVYPLLRILIIGTACNALVTIPYMTQIAYGWTKLGLYQNVIAIIILIPSLIYLTNKYGASGAVWVWAVLNAGYIFFSMPVMFNKILKKEMWNWYWNDVFMILLVAIIPMTLFRLLLNYLHLSNIWVIVAYCSIAFSIVLLITTLKARHTREFIINLYRKFMTNKPISQ
jgi:O-antigen/teichoic acid export membrane protein